jgi:hypothetical protein
MSEECLCGRHLIPGVWPVCEECHQPPSLCVCPEMPEEPNDGDAER